MVLELRDLVLQTLLLREEAFVAVQTVSDGAYLALLTVILAGIATALGQSAVLFINRVTPRRFLIAVLVSSGFYVFSYLAWSLSLWTVSSLFFGATTSLAAVVRVVGLSYAPLVLAFLAFVPFIGLALGGMLSLWSLFAVIVGMQVGLDLTLWQAFVCAGLGWLILQLLQRSLGLPLLRLSNWLKAHAAGVEHIEATLETHELVDVLRQEVPVRVERPALRAPGRRAA